jgi:hypothetical protein
LEKAIVEEIKEGKRKEKEEKQVKRATKLGLIVNRTARKCAKKHVRTKFIIAWTIIVVTKMGDCFH